jgi:hypothetical protein
MATRICRLSKSADIALIALFLAVIGLPFVFWLHGDDRAVSEENRLLARLPRLQWKAAVLKAFPTDFEAYFNDQFGFRRLLIRVLSLARYGLGISTSPQVVVGPRGWLYYAHEKAGHDYQTTRPFSPEQLAAWKEALEYRHAWCAARGIRYLFVIAPDKQTIYPEHLPRSVRKRQLPSRWDQLVEHLRASNSPARVLDLRPALWQAKAKEQIYCDRDTHWNDAGAHVAYQEIMTALAADQGGMEP